MQSMKVVITGATSGIGRAVARRYAQDGAAIAVIGRNAERGQETVNEIKQCGGTAMFYGVDVSSKERVVEVGEAISAEWGAPDVLVNAAGILQSGQRVLDQDEGENERLWAANYNGTLFACQVFGKQMRMQGRGAILNIGSLACVAPLSLPAYTPGKAAILSLTQILAAELGPFGIRVNAVAPGYTLSDGLREKIRLGLRNPDAIKASTALGTFVEPEQVADAIHFLCSNRAATITGVLLPVDAGWLVQAPYQAYLKGNPLPIEKSVS